MTRPRRALLEEPEDAEPVVRHVPRRSSGPLPPVEAAPPADQVDEPAPRPRRALPALPDPSDAEEEPGSEWPEEPGVGTPGDPVGVAIPADFDDEPPTLESESESDRVGAARLGAVEGPAAGPSPDEDDQPRPARALVEPQPVGDAGEARADVNGGEHRPARAWIEPEPAPIPTPTAGSDRRAATGAGAATGGPRGTDHDAGGYPGAGSPTRASLVPRPCPWPRSRRPHRRRPPSASRLRHRPRPPRHHRAPAPPPVRQPVPASTAPAPRTPQPTTTPRTGSTAAPRARSTVVPPPQTDWTAPRSAASASPPPAPPPAARIVADPDLAGIDAIPGGYGVPAAPAAGGGATASPDPPP